MSKNVLVVAVIVGAAAWLLTKGRGAASPYKGTGPGPGPVGSLLPGTDDWTLWVGATGQLWWVYKGDVDLARQAGMRPADPQESMVPGTYLRWTPQDL